jgi:Outer membrane protein beta-barrel domain
MKFRSVALLLNANPTLPILAARPDSLRPPRPPARRWALQLVAGPTFSYRNLAAAPPIAGRPNTAPLERPALGFGAQVQVRRVLTGRWALVAGLGYHEYATELMLRVLPTPWADSAARAVWQRDSYRLLTVPVQLGYALGAPRGPWQAAVLAGAEANLYLSGRSTEGSTCDCQQLAYPNAAASPFRPWSLALSLGFDLRYRLGTSRWQWLVQPTGRYVLSPFVRADAAGFAPRQPFSLGVLTGFSWDVR